MTSGIVATSSVTIFARYWVLPARAGMVTPLWVERVSCVRGPNALPARGLSGRRVSASDARPCGVPDPAGDGWSQPGPGSKRDPPRPVIHARRPDAPARIAAHGSADSDQ